MFEQEYKRANDRIHPRKDLLKEMEAQWAKEAAQPVEEEDKVVAFPGWVRYASMAAGVLLCIGLGMGSVMLFTRSRGIRNKTAAADAPMMMESVAAEEKILTEAAPEAQNEGVVTDGSPMEAKMVVTVNEPPQGMHAAMDEAEVEDAVRYGERDRASEEAELAASLPKAAKGGTGEPAEPNQTGEPAPEVQTAAAPVALRYGPGQLLQRDGLMALFMPTAEQVHVVRYDQKKLTAVFSLSLRGHGVQVKQIFWMGSEIWALQERNGDTELLRFDVADWAAPKHLKNLTQSGTFLGAGEMDGRLCVLSLYRATEEEPLPWVNGERIDYTRVLLDGERPGDTFTVLTVYDPARDGFVSQTALLAESCGAAFGKDGLLLWTEGEEAELYAFSCGPEGLALKAQGTRPGTVRAAAAGDGFTLLMEARDGVTLVKLDDALNETAKTAGKGTGPVRFAQVFEDGAFYLTEDALHWLKPAGDRTLAISGDGFRRLSSDRLLVMSASGQLQLVSLDGDDPKALAAMEVKDRLELLLEDPSRADYDQATGRLVFPAGPKVYQFRIDETGGTAPRSVSMAFMDHDETEQRELRCLLTGEGALIFCKDSVVICNENLAHRSATKY